MGSESIAHEAEALMGYWGIYIFFFFGSDLSRYEENVTKLTFVLRFCN